MFKIVIENSYLHSDLRMSSAKWIQAITYSQDSLLMRKDFLKLIQWVTW